MTDHLLGQLLKQQLIQQGGHQLFSLTLISLILAIIHDIVRLPLIYMHLYISSICLRDSHAYACPTLCRTLHVKSEGWILHAVLAEGFTVLLLYLTIVAMTILFRSQLNSSLLFAAIAFVAGECIGE